MECQPSACDSRSVEGGGRSAFIFFYFLFLSLFLSFAVVGIPDGCTFFTVMRPYPLQKKVNICLKTSINRPIYARCRAMRHVHLPLRYVKL